MRITALHAQHFLGAPNRAFTLRAPVVCIAGPNGAGKSSLIEAIRFALAALVPRGITRKGDYEQLVTLGAKKGSVAITVDDNPLVREVKTGKLIAGDPLPEAVERWLPAVLDAHTFPRLPAAEQKTFMFALLGISMGWPVVKAELERANVPELLVNTIAGPIRGGFAAAAEFAKDRVTEHRATWRAITGEKQYGVNIAEVWTAPGADAPEVEVNTKMQEARVELARSTLHDAQQTLAQRRTGRTAYLQAQEALDGAPSAKQLDKAVAAAQAAVATAEERLGVLEQLAASGGGTTTPCPACAVLLRIDRGALTVAPEGGATASPAHLTELAALRRELPALRQAEVAAERQRARLEGLRAALPATVTERDVTDAEAAADEAEAELRTAEQELRDASADAHAAAEGRRITAAARAAHEDVVAWTALEKLLLPDGIPTTLLLRGLTPFNKGMATIAGEIGWQAPRLGADFVLRVGEVAYHLLSESEQWRVDAVLALAVSVHSGVKLALLDRFDVLDVPSRNQLLGWLGVAGKDLFDTVIVAGTLKAKPTVLTEQFGVQVLWLDGTATRVQDDTDAAEAGADEVTA